VRVLHELRHHAAGVAAATGAAQRRQAGSGAAHVRRVHRLHGAVTVRARLDVYPLPYLPSLLPLSRPLSPVESVARHRASPRNQRPPDSQHVCMTATSHGSTRSSASSISVPRVRCRRRYANSRLDAYPCALCDPFHRIHWVDTSVGGGYFTRVGLVAWRERVVGRHACSNAARRLWRGICLGTVMVRTLRGVRKKAFSTRVAISNATPEQTKPLCPD
jgi:hypothetical protein